MVYANDKAQFENSEQTSDKPRIAVMGEFSVGKSTLCNLLLGEPVLPTKVTATRLPPMWISYGEGEPIQVDKQGEKHPVEVEQIARLRTEETSYIRMFKQSDLLKMCDLIDMPGISDPNMADIGWGEVVDEADAVIWCTHSTQAWRQSEAASWGELPDDLRDKGMLLLTRFDKLTNERDKKRVIQRVENETAGAFRGIYPISLTAAMDARDNVDLLREAGAEQLARGIVDLLTELGAVNTTAAS